MAFNQMYTFSNIATFLTDLATFAAANGWTVASQSSTSITVSKGGTAFRVDYVSANSVRLFATPSGGSINTSTIPIDSFSSGSPYCFVSCGTSLYIGRTASGVWNWGGIVAVVDKIGSWSGGIGLVGCSAQNNPFSKSSSYITFYINGGWSPLSGVAGSVFGSIGYDLDLFDRQPFEFNAGVMPGSVILFVVHSTTSLYRPIGYAEGLCRFRAGDVYVAGDNVVIGSDTYLAMPFMTAALSATSTARDLLFKLGA